MNGKPFFMHTDPVVQVGQNGDMVVYSCYVQIDD